MWITIITLDNIKYTEIKIGVTSVFVRAQLITFVGLTNKTEFATWYISNATFL